MADLEEKEMIEGMVKIIVEMMIEIEEETSTEDPDPTIVTEMTECMIADHQSTPIVEEDQDQVQEITEWENTIHMVTVITEAIGTTTEMAEMVTAVTEDPSAMKEEIEDTILETMIETTADHQEACQDTTVEEIIRITAEDMMMD